MSSRRKSPWERRIEAQVHALEERIVRGLKAERHAREIDGAHTDEEMEALDDRLKAIVNEQARLMQRLRWLESRLPIAGRPPRRPKN